MSSIVPIRVIKVGLDPKRPAQTRLVWDPNTNLITTYVTQYWLVQFNQRQPDPTACYSATDGKRTIPTVTQPYTTQPNDQRKAISVQPQLIPESAEQLYRVQVDYATPVVTSGGQTGKWDVNLSIDGVPVTESYFFDLDDIPVINSAGQQFSQQPSRGYVEQQIEISFKTDSWDESDGESLEQMISNSSITLNISRLGYSRTWPTASLRFNKQRVSTSLQAGQLAYWSVALDLTYRSLVTAPAHCKTSTGTDISSSSISSLEYDVLTDQGFAYWDASTSSLVNFLDKNGQQTNAPGLLNGSGGAVTPNGSTSGAPSPTSAHFIAFRKAKRGNVGALLAGIT